MEMDGCPRKHSPTGCVGIYRCQLMFPFVQRAQLSCMRIPFIENVTKISLLTRADHVQGIRGFLPKSVGAKHPDSSSWSLHSLQGFDWLSTPYFETYVE